MARRRKYEPAVAPNNKTWVQHFADTSTRNAHDRLAAEDPFDSKYDDQSHIRDLILRDRIIRASGDRPFATSGSISRQLTMPKEERKLGAL